MRLLLINGPNLNLLGDREPAIYGAKTLAEVESMVTAAAAADGHAVRCFQSNHEGALVDAIQDAGQDCDGIIINGAGFTHTSVVLRDALAAVGLPFVEIHISNVFRREPFRHHSYLSALAIGTVGGFGTHGYLLALNALTHYLTQTRTSQS